MTFAMLALALGLVVTDGDTIMLNGVKIRIANIDAPELRHAQCDAERRLAIVAKARIGVLLKAGVPQVRIGDPATGRRIDRYGRTLATIAVDGHDVGETMVAEGLARAWTGKREPWCEQR